MTSSTLARDIFWPVKKKKKICYFYFGDMKDIIVDVEGGLKALV